VRREAERELAALAHRRDSINAPLSNVREMLATLTGAAVPGADPANAAGPSGRPTLTPTGRTSSHAETRR
jgi:hypothetical protein